MKVIKYLVISVSEKEQGSFAILGPLLFVGKLVCAVEEDATAATAQKALTSQ